MNVALVTSSFFPHTGGVEEVVRQLAVEHRSASTQCLVVTNRWPKTLPAADSYHGIPVRRHMFRVPERTWRQMGGAFLCGPATVRGVCRDIQSHRCGLIHVHCVSSNAYYALWAKRRLGLPLVATLHGELRGDATGLFTRSAFARSLLRRVLAEADAITAPSARTLADAEEFLGASLGARAVVIPNGVRLSDFGRLPHTDHAGLVLCLGRLVPQKGFDTLIRAYAQLVRDGESVGDLVVAGDGPERGRLEQLAAELGVSRLVKFTGAVASVDVPRLMASCAMFVMPSVQEAFGIAALEAMAAGKPIIATSVGGIPELVRDRFDGMLVPPADPEALAHALATLARDAGLRARYADAARTRAAAFDWSAIAAKYTAVYDRVLEAALARAASERRHS